MERGLNKQKSTIKLFFFLLNLAINYKPIEISFLRFLLPVHFVVVVVVVVVVFVVAA